MTKRYALITGASGLLGTWLNQHLTDQGFTTIGWRHKRLTACHFNVQTVAELAGISRRLELVINLAGAPIAGGLWNEDYKAKLRDSRIQFSQHLIEQLAEQSISVGHFIAGSAIGFYGTGQALKTEASNVGDDFSAKLCQDWEAVAQSAPSILQCKLSIARTGLVLAPKGSFLQPFWLTNLFGLGSVFGTGQQGISWIDYRDWLAAIEHLYRNEHEGVFNLTAPNPVSQQQFVDTLAQVKKRPRWLRIPSLLFKPLGELKTLFIDGQFVQPKALMASEFRFKFASLKQSLESVHDSH